MLKIRKRQQKIPTWVDYFKRLLKERLADGKEVYLDHVYDAADGINSAHKAFQLRVPTILAILLFSIGLTVVNPLVPAAFGVFAFELIKDLASNLVWKIFENPMKLSEYYRSGKLEEDLEKELKKEDFQEKVAQLLQKTNALEITLGALVSQKNKQLLEEFKDALHKYPIILAANRSSLLAEAEKLSWAPEIGSLKNAYIKSLSQKTIIVHKRVSKSTTHTYNHLPFPWGRWILSWIFSLLIGAIILFLLVNKAELANFNKQVSPQFQSTPLSTIICNTPYPSPKSIQPMALATETLNPEEVEQTSTPEGQSSFRLLSTVTGTDKDGHSISIPAGAEVSPMEWRDDKCQVWVLWEGKKIKINWNAMEGKSCP